jgi:serine/threonine-protein kinase
MGIVVSAHHIGLDERVALKFLLPEALTQRVVLERFLREARAAAKIKSEHIARVIDVGTVNGGAPYIAMEYLEGADLATLLKTNGCFSVKDAVDLVLQTCEALAEAHALGIVHRDLKPPNLFCVRRPDGRNAIKVLDFGISKVAEASVFAQGVTQSGAMLGTPAYVSPEQLHHPKSVDMRTDVWALGVVLFELLTGTTPFEAESLAEIAMKITYAACPPVQVLRSDVPDALAAVILRCLEKERERRFPTVGELALALGAFGSRHARNSVDRVLSTLAAAGLATYEPPESSDPRRLGARLQADARPLHPAEPSPAVSPNVNVGDPRSISPRGDVFRQRVGVAAPSKKKWANVAFVGAGLLLLVAIAAGSALASSWASSAWRDEPRKAATEAPISTGAPAPLDSTLPAKTESSPAPSTSSTTAASRSPQRAHRPPRPSVSSGGAPSATAPLADCTVPYFIDTDGHRQYKTECIQ